MGNGIKRNKHLEDKSNKRRSAPSELWVYMRVCMALGERFGFFRRRKGRRRRGKILDGFSLLSKAVTQSQKSSKKVMAPLVSVPFLRESSRNFRDSE